MPGKVNRRVILLYLRNRKWITWIANKPISITTIVKITFVISSDVIIGWNAFDIRRIFNLDTWVEHIVIPADLMKIPLFLNPCGLSSY